VRRLAVKVEALAVESQFFTNILISLLLPQPLEYAQFRGKPAAYQLKRKYALENHALKTGTARLAKFVSSPDVSLAPRMQGTIP
jgi:hypothetical protein